MTFQKTPKNTGRRRTLEQVRKDARAAELYRQGLTYQQVGEAMQPPVNKATAFRMIQRAVRDAQADALKGQDAYTMILEGFRDSLRIQQEIIDRPHYVVSVSGKIVTKLNPATGEEEPLLDDGPCQRALTEKRHLLETMAKLYDAFPASKSRVEVVTEDVVDREIEKLAKEIAEAGKNAGIPVEK